MSAATHEDDRSDAERLESIRRLKADIALAKTPELSALEERLYKHVLDCIDFGALSGIEQLLWHAIDTLGHGALDDELGLSRRLIQRTLTRAAHDPTIGFTDVPFGITKAEQRAVRFDPECLFCQVEDEAATHEAADDASRDAAEHDHGGEPCSLCDALAREWRAKHADQLRAARERRAPSQPASRKVKR